MKRSRLSLLENYVAGDLDAAGRLEVEELLERDPALRDRLAEMEAAHDALSVLRDRPEPPVRAHDVLPAIQAAISSQSFAPREKLYLESPTTRFYRRAALAATLLFAVTAGLFVVRAMRTDDTAAHDESPLVIDNKPTPAERGLEPFLDAARGGPINGEQYRRLLEGQDPERVLFVPTTNAMPIVAGAAESDYR